MSAKLFNEPKPNAQRKPGPTSKRIDDMILDAELEAQDEINRRIRSEKVKMVILVLLGVGLFYALNMGIDNKTISVPSFLSEEPELAQAPTSPPAPPAPDTTPAVVEPAPKPIPFPLSESRADAPSTSTQNDQTNNLTPLENDVLTMLQANMKDGAPATPSPPAAEQPVAPASPEEPEQSASAIWSPEAQPKAPQAPAAVSPVPPVAETPPAVIAKAPVPTPKPMTAEQSRYFIQVGAFSVKANADRVIQRLMSGGYSPLVQTRTSRSSMHVVFIGGFANSDSSKSMMSALRNKGLNPQLNKNDNGSFSIILGKEKSKAQAEAFKQKLTRMGIFTSLKKMKINSRIFVVRVEGFGSGTSARHTQKKIEGLGYTGTIIRKKS